MTRRDLSHYDLAVTLIKVFIICFYLKQQFLCSKLTHSLDIVVSQGISKVGQLLHYLVTGSFILCSVTCLAQFIETSQDLCGKSRVSRELAKYMITKD